MRVERSAFTVEHHEGVLTGGTLQSGANILPNGDAETGDFTGWATSTNWTVQAAAGTVPPGREAYAFRAGSGATKTLSTLLSNRFAALAGRFYHISLEFGAGGKKPKNTLKFRIKWWDAGVGGNLKGTTPWQEQVVTPNTTYLHGFSRRMPPSPAGTTYGEIEILNYANKNLTASQGTVLDNVSVYLEVVESFKPTLIESLRHNSLQKTKAFSGLKYSSNYRTGFKSCTFQLHDEPHELWRWVTQALGHHIEVYFENAQVWSGMVWDIDGNIDGFGGVHISYDNIWNVVDVASTHGSRALDLPSQKRYGRIHHAERDLYISYPSMTETRANYLLAHHKDPMLGDSNASERNTLTVTCMGYWATLSFCPVGDGFRTAGPQDTSAVVATLGAATGEAPESILSLYHKINPFVSKDYSRCQLTGLTVRSVELDDVPEGTPSVPIARLMSYGDSNKRHLISGVWEDRRFVIRSRSIAHDYLLAEDGDYRSAKGAYTPRPLLQAGALVRSKRPVPTWISYTADEFYDPACRFWTEVEYDAEQDTISAQTPDTSDADVLIRAITWRGVVRPEGPGSRYPLGSGD